MANDSSKRHTIDPALISLVTDLAHKERNTFLPIHSNVYRIVVVAKKTRERCVYRGKGDQQRSSTLFSKRTYQEAPSSGDPLACATTSFVFPSLCATTASRCWCRRETVHVTLASLVELLAWTDLRSPLSPLPACRNGDSLEIKDAPASVDILSVISVNSGGPATS